MFHRGSTVEEFTLLAGVADTLSCAAKLVVQLSC